MPSTISIVTIRRLGTLKPNKKLSSSLIRHYICPSCLSRAKVSYSPSSNLYDARPTPFSHEKRRPPRRKVSTWPYSSIPNSSKRQASSIAPVVSVNARRDIPHEFQELHGRLRELEKKAGSFVNLSQLKLAIRGLESENAAVRIAVLGLYLDGGKSGTVGARELVRLLLADPLVAEQLWEAEVYDSQRDSEGALLLRYGEVYRDERGPDLRTLTIPCRWLEKHNVELLVSELVAGEDVPRPGGVRIADAVDVLQFRVGPTVEYPVHKTLIYKDRFDHARPEKGVSVRASAGVIESVRSKLGKDMLVGVLNELMDLNMDMLESLGLKTDLDNVILVDLFDGFNSFGRLRGSLDSKGSSLKESPTKWSDGEISQVQEWLLQGTQSETSDLKPAIKKLIHYMLESVERSILGEETQNHNQLASITIPKSTREDLEEAITSWSESAHTELRNSLETALYTKAWKRLAWWKLFWRVDDVDMLTRDILERVWLVEAEKGLIWVGGRIQQAGLLGSTKSIAVREQKRNEPIFGTFPESLQIADLMDDTPVITGDPPTVNLENPYPQTLAIARSFLSTVTIPPLQSLSQRLLLQTISTVTTTSVLSGLLYYSISTTSIYEAGTIAALGLVWSLRRLQKKWENARREWIGTVREEARKTLRTAEERFRKVVRENGIPMLDQAGVEERKVAREMVDKVKEALKRVGK